MKDQMNKVSAYRSLVRGDSALWRRIPLPLLIIAGGVVIALVLIALKPSPAKTHRKQVAALVSVIRAETTSVPAVIEGFGTVEAVQQLDLRPQVSGHIVEVSPNFQIGGRLAKGEVLARIDPRDYQIAVESQQAALANAEVELKLEEGNRVVAQREWKLLEEDLKVSNLGKQLALREPQLNQKKAAFKAAQSQLEKAKLDLERTVLKSPFPAVVLDENVEIGTFVSPQTMIGTLASTDEFYVHVRIPRNLLRWISFAEDGSATAVNVKIIQQLGSDKTAQRQGRLVRLLGDVDKAGRMARVLVAVKNPLASQGSAPPLLIGSYVRVLIEGRDVEGVVKLPRSAIREGSRVWIADQENKLEIEEVEQVFSMDDYVFVRGDMVNKRIIVSPLSVPLRGMLLEPVTRNDGGKPIDVTQSAETSDSSE